MKIKPVDKLAFLRRGYYPRNGVVKILLCMLFLAVSGVIIAKPVFGQEDAYPNWWSGLHNVGNIELGIDNWGGISKRFSIDDNGRTCVFPKGSELEYMSQIILWIGGIVGRDTLVSTGQLSIHQRVDFGELHPYPGAESEFEERSILSSSPYRHKDAVSEQDFICSFTDIYTDPSIVGDDEYDYRPHIPLHVRVNQRSYAWSVEYAADFVMFNCYMINIGEYPIKEMYLGLNAAPMSYHASEYVNYGIYGYNLMGLRRAVNIANVDCASPDTVFIAWNANKDGHPTTQRQWDYRSLRSIIGLHVIRPAAGDMNMNYNWWFSHLSDPLWNWGPRLAPTDDDPWREIGMELGAPLGDRNRYYMMSHPEVDYDQMFTAISHTYEGFLPPPPWQMAEYIAGGNYAHDYLLSYGPFDLLPGDSIPFTFAIIGGENFHKHPRDYENYWDPYQPELYYQNLDFSDLEENCRWARAIFDNPGVDTDGDGYRGEFCWKYIWRDTTEADPSDSFAVDSFRYFYTGDTIPDFKAMTPPPPPSLRVYPDHGKVILRWNGQESENTPDYFSGQVDFEGYRVYYGQGNRLSDYVLLASYDIDDFIVFQFDTNNRFWKKISNSARHDSLKQIYGTEFDANEYYDQYNYFLDPYTGKIYYYVHQDWNQSDLSNPLGIHKVYPDASPYDSADITEEGWRRYYEYEYVIDNLQPSVPYYFAVTAFDYGALQYDIGQLETSPQTNAIREYPLPSSDTVEHRGLNVIVYPNPYRIDAGYARAGYENRDRTRAAAWSRRIHFANLPRICKIRIYTLAGDLVQEIDHYYPEGGPESQHEEWNVISRNTQEVVTGIYIWSVRSEMGEQLGKLVIIK